MDTILRSRLRHQRRAFTGVILAVGIATAFITLVLGVLASADRFIADSAAPRAQHADLVVRMAELGTGQEPTPITEEHAAAVRALPGVASVGTAASVTRSITTPTEVLTVDIGTVAAADSLAWYTITSGAAPSQPGDILVDDITAQRHDLRPGMLVDSASPIGVDASAAGAETQTLRIAGVIQLAGPSVTSIVLAQQSDVAHWQRIQYGDQWISELDIDLTGGADSANTLAEVRTVLPGMVVDTGPRAAAAQVDQMFGGGDVLSLILFGFTGIATLVAVVVVANTFSIVYAQRLRELALLRCVGASARQLRRSHWRESLVVGAVASAFGVLAGNLLLVVAAWGLPFWFSGLRGAVPVIGLTSIVLPLLVGTLVTLAAASGPARRACRVAPLAALRPDAPTIERRTSALRLAGAAMLALAGVAAVVFGLGALGGSAVLTGVFGGSLLALAVALAAPTLVAVAVRLAEVIMRMPGLRRRGILPRLALANAGRNPARAATTTVALFLGVGLITVVSVGRASIENAVVTEAYARNPVDVVVATDGLSASGDPLAISMDVGTDPASQDSVGESGAPSPVPASDPPSTEAPSTAAAPSGAAAGGTSGTDAAGTETSAEPTLGASLEAVAKLPGTLGVAPLRAVEVTRVGPPSPPLMRSATVLGGDPKLVAAAVRVPLPLTDEVLLVPDDTLDMFGGDGSTISLAGAGGHQVELTVRGVRQLPVLLVTDATATRLGASDATPAALIQADPDVDATAYLGAVQRALAPARGTVVTGGLGDVAGFSDALRTANGIAVALLSVSVVIAVVGLANTLALSIHERGQESALQRALGLTRRGLRLTLALEAAVLAGISCALGLLIGIPLGWAGAKTIVSDLAPMSLLVLPWAPLGMLVLIAIGSAMVASVLPGRRAARVAPATALSEA